MEDLKRAYYEVRFRLQFIESTGESFQSFFSTIMEMRYPSDFVRVRPWGSAGDRKNDGYLRSQRKLFQCYAPREMHPLSKWLTKINVDFEEALPHWKTHFDQWIFTHNDVNGLPPDVLKALLDLSQQHEAVTATHWGYAEILREFKALSATDVATLLGPAPGLQDVVAVRLVEVKQLLEHIVLQPEPRTVEVRPVPAAKLQYNQLSEAVAILLRAGMTRAEIVKLYLRGLADQTRHDRMAAVFRLHYEELRSQGFPPDDIFTGLQKFVAGKEVPSPSRQAAALAILAFFFEACEIFERPPDGSNLVS